MGNKIDPGDGFRLLKVGEKIREGDEYYSPSRDRWYASCDASERCPHQLVYRRQVAKTYPPSGYRLLTDKECPEPGDVFKFDREPTGKVWTVDLSDYGSVHFSGYWVTSGALRKLGYNFYRKISEFRVTGNLDYNEVILDAPAPFEGKVEVTLKKL